MKQTNILEVANDLGYGNEKITFNGTDRYMQPTVISPIVRVTNNTINHTDKDAVEKTVENLLNEMNVVIDNKQYLVGNAAKNSTIEHISTDINARKGKAHMSMSKIVPLSTIAAYAVQQAHKAGKNIFSPIEVDVVMANNLPINEMANDPSVKDYYANLFTGKNHIVIFKNFDNDISVTINFKEVNVYKEGEVAISIARKYSKELRQYLIKTIGEYYPKVDAKEFLENVKNILGIDIGFQTVDFPLIINGNGDPFNSTSINSGYGNVLASGWQYLPQLTQGYSVKDVVAFQNLLNSKPRTEIDEENKNYALEAEKTATPELIRNVITRFNSIISNTENLELVLLMGGGTIPLMERTDYREQLVESLKLYRSSALVIPLDKEFATYANLIGLEILAHAMVAKYK
ncbi:ParM/StbA family protein [Lactobacillus hominis]|uniref:ParM/StbA family protein n=1 Tax=Lactobacillus hominis TaxID=1203033 RepID=UPI002630FADD|nr:ParM/StbA family protein [Lactobacillus hominis]